MEISSYKDLLDETMLRTDWSSMTPEQKKEMVEFLWEVTIKAAREDFYTFVKVMAPVLIPGFKTGRHIELISNELQNLYEAIWDNDKTKSKLQVFLPPESMKPLCENTTYVLMSDGTQKKLKDIKVGDHVITHEGRSRRVSAVHKQGKLPAMKLRSDKGREVISAYDHPFLTPRGWIEAQDLKINEALAVLDGYETTIPNLQYCAEFSDDDFRLAGYFIGDGSIKHANITCYDKKLQKEILALADKKGWDYRFKKDGNEIYFKGGVREWFDKVGIDRKATSADKRVPDFVFSGTKKQVALFMGAYFDCDGCISQKKKENGEPRDSFAIFYESKSEQLLKDCLQLCSYLGLDFRLREVTRQWRYKGKLSRGTYYYLGSTDRDSCARFCSTVELKGEKADKVDFNMLYHQKWPEKYIPDLLKEKKYLTEEVECRCLTVEEDHSFVANGLVVHNTVLCSHLFPAWVLGKHPHWRVIAVAHSADHAAKELGANSKRIVTLQEYQTIFPKTKVSRESPGVGFWKTTKGGYYFSGGWKTQFPGKRANLLIGDDIVSEQTKPSEIKEINKNYSSGLESRLLEDNSGQLIVNCLAEDTSVLMGDGSRKSIKDVVVGDMVLTWNHGRHEMKPVEAVIPQGKAMTYKIVTRNGTVRATDRHPWLCAKTLTWIKTEDLKKGDEILFSGSRLGDSSSFFYSLDEAWLTGFMMGDGWTIKNLRKDNGRPRYVTCFAAGMDEDLNNRVLKTFKSLYKAPMKYQKNERYYRSDRKEPTQRLIDLGVEGKAKTKRVPGWVFDEPYDFRLAYLNGFLDADGHEDPKGMRIVGLCNEELVKDIKALAESLGYKVSNVWHIQYRVKPPNSPEEIDAHQYKISIGKTIDLRTFTSTKVKSIEEFGEEEVYDLAVKDNHNFIAEGLVCHNTRWYINDIAGYLEGRDGGITPTGIKSGADSERPWKIIRVPAILDAEGVKLLSTGDSDPERFEVGGSYWPEHKAVENLLDAKRRMTPHQWNALYLQSPIPEDGAIFDSKRFKLWLHPEPPEVSSVIISLDTAFSEKETKDSAESVYEVWGVFPMAEATSTGKESVQGNMILLAYDKGHWSFPELKAICQKLYSEYSQVLDFFLVENRASGISLIQELRAIGLPVVEYNPDRDKTSRAHSASALVHSGRVYLNTNLMFSQMFLAELQKFPAGGLDTTDAFSQAVIWMRDNWKIIPKDYSVYDEEDEDIPYKRRPRSYWQSTQAGTRH